MLPNYYKWTNFTDLWWLAVKRHKANRDTWMVRIKHRLHFHICTRTHTHGIHTACTGLLLSHSQSLQIRNPNEAALTCLCLQSKLKTCLGKSRSWISQYKKLVSYLLFPKCINMLGYQLWMAAAAATDQSRMLFLCAPATSAMYYTSRIRNTRKVIIPK